MVADWRTAPLRPELAATLVFLEKLTLRPDELEPADAEAVRAAGVSTAALRDAATVSALFNMIVRLADSFGWDIPTWESLQARAARCSKAATRSARSESALAPGRLGHRAERRFEHAEAAGALEHEENDSATSSAVIIPGRTSGVRPRPSSRAKSVATPPGQTFEQRIPCSRSSWSSARVKPTWPNFDAQ